MRRNAPPRAGAARFAGTSLAWAVLVLPPRTHRAIIPHMPAEPYSETIPVPASVRFPVELEPPEGFRPEEPASWPRIDGRLEWIGGRLLYMPPCGWIQQGVSVSVVTVLGQWQEERPDFLRGRQRGRHDPGRGRPRPRGRGVAAGRRLPADRRLHGGPAHPRRRGRRARGGRARAAREGPVVPRPRRGRRVARAAEVARRARRDGRRREPPPPRRAPAAAPRAAGPRARRRALLPPARPARLVSAPSGASL